VEDEDDEIAVKAEVLGFEANEIDVQLRNTFLTSKAEKRPKKDDQGESYWSHRRTLALPCGIMEEKATATCLNGVFEPERAKGSTFRSSRRENGKAGRDTSMSHTMMSSGLPNLSIMWHSGRNASTAPAGYSGMKRRAVGSGDSHQGEGPRVAADGCLHRLPEPAPG